MFHLADPILTASQKVATKMEHDVDKITKPIDDWAKDVDHWFQERVDVSRRLSRIGYMAMMPTSPLAAFIFLKNKKNNPGMPMDQVIDRSQVETFDKALEIANNIWPGTKPGTKDKVVGLTKEVAKMANVALPE